MNSLIFIFITLWCISAVILYVLNRKLRREQYIEPPRVLQEDECTNCVRYFDTVICKCKTYQEDPSAFLYPTDITPDTDINLISSQPIIPQNK